LPRKPATFAGSSNLIRTLIQPGLEFTTREPADAYRYVYDLPADELADLVYLFDTDDAGRRMSRRGCGCPVSIRSS
jgi:hypothetical protein